MVAFFGRFNAARALLANARPRPSLALPSHPKTRRHSKRSASSTGWCLAALEVDDAATETAAGSAAGGFRCGFFFAVCLNSSGFLFAVAAASANLLCAFGSVVGVFDHQVAPVLRQGGVTLRLTGAFPRRRFGISAKWSGTGATTGSRVELRLFECYRCTDWSPGREQ